MRLRGSGAGSRPPSGCTPRAQRRCAPAVSPAPVWPLAGAMTQRREHRVAVMAKPVLVVVDDEHASLQALTLELESRYGVHYRVVSGSSADVALVLADQRMPGMGGTQLLARVRQFFPTARRGLLVTWGDMASPAPFLEAAALGWLEFYLIKP